MLLHRTDSLITFPAIFLLLLAMFTDYADCLIFQRGSAFGYLAAVALPLDLPNRDVYVAFNFEANYALPTNDSYNQWIDRWSLDKNYLGIGNNVTTINGRRAKRSPQYTRGSFYRSLAGYLEHFNMNGTACLLRTICEVAASSLHENNGLLGSIFKILFLPTTSAAENNAILMSHYEAEQAGENERCWQYTKWCPAGPLDLISKWL